MDTYTPKGLKSRDTIAVRRKKRNWYLLGVTTGIIIGYVLKALS